MIVRLVVVGRVRGPLAEAVAHYEERARRYWRLEVTEVEAGARGRSSGPDRVRSAEGERILARLDARARVVALTRRGRRLESRALADLLEDGQLHALPEVAFVIGGAFGLAEGVLARADLRWSLSALTLPHELARLVLAEQLYRAGTILRNEPYHKGG